MNADLDTGYSVIIPVYNVAAYLRECLDSVLRQDLPAAQIIAVDDGSTDESGQILEEYARVHPVIQVIHQANQGVGAARNAGLGLARGQFVGFVDPDDFILPSFFRDLAAAVVAGDLDIAIANGRRLYPDGATAEIYPVPLPEGIVGGQEWYAKALRTRDYGHYVYLMLMRRSWLVAHALHFPADRIHEDVMWTTVAMLRARRVQYHHHDQAYRYRQRPGSLVSARTDWEIARQVSSLLANNVDCIAILKTESLLPSLRDALLDATVNGNHHIAHRAEIIGDPKLRYTAMRAVLAAGTLSQLWRYRVSRRRWGLFKKLVKFSMAVSLGAVRGDGRTVC